MNCQHTHTPYPIELLAIRRALLWILDNSSIKPFVILSDCQSALESLNNGKRSHNHKAINDILNILDQAKSCGKDIVFAWIPGHVVLPGNEEADKLARGAASEMTEIQKAPISKVEARNTIKHQCLRLWDEEYQSIEKGSHYKMFQPSVLKILPPTSDRFMDSMLFRLGAYDLDTAD